MRKTLIAVGILGGVVAAGAIAAGSATVTGPSSSTAPYVLPAAPGVITKSILTVGDSVDGYRMVGIPDGLGAYESRPGTFTLLSNHELSTGNGTVRDHGATGAFVSKWTIAGESLRVAAGRDLSSRIATYNVAAGAYDPPAKGVALNRLCSADLAARSAFYDAKSGVGYNGPLFLSGEEAGSEGRAFAHAEGGISWELPSLGKFSWENANANPGTGRKTVVVGTDDSTPGQVYVYVGEKQASGNPAERAGLTGGKLFGIRVPGFAIEPPNTGIPSGTPFTAADLGDVRAKTGAQLQADSTAAGVTQWYRPEDSAWDPKHPNDLYFVITASFADNSKLYRLRFADAANPAAGGTVDQLLTGTETGGTAERLHMLDNLTVDRSGNVLLQEDPGNNAYLARIWQYEITKDRLAQVAVFDPAIFAPGGPSFLTQDEESSGIIDAAAVLGKGCSSSTPRCTSGIRIRSSSSTASSWPSTSRRPGRARTTTAAARGTTGTGTDPPRKRSSGGGLAGPPPSFRPVSVKLGRDADPARLADVPERRRAGLRPVRRRPRA